MSTERNDNGQPKSFIQRKPEVFATIVVAVIGLIGTVTVALFGFLGTVAEIEKPLEITQTAESRLTQAISLITPTPESSPTETPAAIAVETVLSSPSLAAGDSIAVDEPAQVSAMSYCVLPTVRLPYRIGQGIDAQEVPSTVLQAYQNGEFMSWEWAPDYARSNTIDVQLAISSTADSGWMQIGNTFFVSVSVEDVPEHVDTVSAEAPGCGGGEYRSASDEIYLTSSFRAYDVNIAFPEFDFYSLQPGEFEAFWIDFKCSDPGIYRVEIEIPYEYFAESGVIRWSNRFICPNSVTDWLLVSDEYWWLVDGEINAIESRGNYMWNGDELIPSP